MAGGWTCTPGTVKCELRGGCCAEQMWWARAESHVWGQHKLGRGPRGAGRPGSGRVLITARKPKPVSLGKSRAEEPAVSPVQEGPGLGTKTCEPDPNK